ncbi:MAG: GNAT family N-acetyltransferase [Mycobacteriales bacterium]
MNEQRVRLRALNEESLGELLEAAVADADPLEVMLPVDGPPGWNAQRKQAFLDFHHQRSIATTTPVETTYVIEFGGRIVGAARLAPTGADIEAGVWIGRSHHGQGIGKAVVAELLTAAKRTGAAWFVAATTIDNLASRALLAELGADLAVKGSEVEASLDLATR